MLSVAYHKYCHKFCSGLRWTLAQFVMQRAELGLKHPVDMLYHVQPWMLVAVLPFAFVFEGMFRFRVQKIIKVKFRDSEVKHRDSEFQCKHI